jgi:hypothetical protein
MFTEAETVVRVADLEITGLEERLSSILDCENTEIVTISSARLHRKQLRGSIQLKQTTAARMVVFVKDRYIKRRSAQ